MRPMLVLAAFFVFVAVAPAAQGATGDALEVCEDAYDEVRGLHYRCTDDGSFEAPDGALAEAVSLGASPAALAATPPPAPYDAAKDYSSNPRLVPVDGFERLWNPASYEHDLCYGSQLGRTSCDLGFWDGMVEACRGAFGRWQLLRYDCFATARLWYLAVRHVGGPFYRPRASADEPDGPPWR